MSNILTFKSKDKLRFVNCGKSMNSIYQKIKQYAQYSKTIMLIGETGVGKDMITREIHDLSKRKDRPLVSVPLSTIPESLIESELFGYDKGAFTGAESEKVGLLEHAQGGTLYFPEITDIPHHIQLKLLDFLQYRAIRKIGKRCNKSVIELDVLIIFASDGKHIECLENGKLRKDFLHRIIKPLIWLPPLRERADEIIPLAEYFIDMYGNRYEDYKFNLTQNAVKFLLEYHWPGNVRELEKLIEEALLNAMSTISTNCTNVPIDTEHFNMYDCAVLADNGRAYKDIFSQIEDLPDFKQEREKFSSAYFTELYKRTKGVQSEAAYISGLSKAYISKKFKVIRGSQK